MGETPLYGNPVREHTLSDGSVIRYKRPTRAARDQAFERALSRWKDLAEQAGKDAVKADGEEKPDERSDEQRRMDHGRFLDRGILLFDAIESWTHNGQCVFGVSPLTVQVIETAPESMQEEAREAVWRAHVDYELRHRKN